MNLGEVNLTLRYMQKAMDAQGIQLKDINTKLDAMNQNFVSVVDFSAFRHLAETNMATKEEVRPLKEGQADHETRIRRLEYSLYIGFGVLMAAQFYLSYIK